MNESCCFIVGAGPDLGLKTIAQRVESPEQLELLKSWGCREAQGYLFSKALRVDAFSNNVLGLEPALIG